MAKLVKLLTIFWDCGNNFNMVATQWSWGGLLAFCNKTSQTKKPMFQVRDNSSEFTETRKRERVIVLSILRIWTGMLRSLSWPPRPPAAPARRLARHAVVCPGMSSRLAMHDPHLPFFSSTLIQYAKILSFDNFFVYIQVWNSHKVIWFGWVLSVHNLLSKKFHQQTLKLFIWKIWKR